MNHHHQKQQLLVKENILFMRVAVYWKVLLAHVGTVLT